jgi:hypothetical protein
MHRISYVDSTTVNWFLQGRIVKMERAGSSKTLIKMYQATQHHIPETAIFMCHIELKGFQFKPFLIIWENQIISLPCTEFPRPIHEQNISSVHLYRHLAYCYTLYWHINLYFLCLIHVDCHDFIHIFYFFIFWSQAAVLSHMSFSHYCQLSQTLTSITADTCNLVACKL